MVRRRAGRPASSGRRGPTPRSGCEARAREAPQKNAHTPGRPLNAASQSPKRPDTYLQEEDLHGAAVLCELAYRSHFSADELRRHAAAVRDAAALSRCELGEVSGHTAGAQRCGDGRGLRGPAAAAAAVAVVPGRVHRAMTRGPCARAGDATPWRNPPRRHAASLLPALPPPQVPREPRAQCCVCGFPGHQAAGRLGRQPTRAPHAAVAAGRGRRVAGARRAAFAQASGLGIRGHVADGSRRLRRLPCAACLRR